MALLSVTTASSFALSLFPNSSFSLLIPSSYRPFQPLSPSSASLRRARCCAATGPPPPPPGNDSRHLKGADLATSLSKIQDRVQIFFAVLFWMSLFFWASAWDGRNRPNKGSRLKR